MIGTLFDIDNHFAWFLVSFWYKNCTLAYSSTANWSYGSHPAVEFC